MERLTFEGSFCDIAQCRELPCPYNGACSQRKVWERLKAYEDTGLEPEEVSALIKDWSDLRTTIGECGGIDRLRELAEADKDGRVAVVHGRWGHLGGDEWLCTACGFVITTEGSWDKPTQKYCEDCGAKMDGGNS